MTPGQYDTGVEDLPTVHPDQTTIPEAPYAPGQLGACYWCEDPAIYGHLDIGLAKRAGQPKPTVNVCLKHYRSVIAPALAERAAEKEAKRIETHQSKRGR